MKTPKTIIFGSAIGLTVVIWGLAFFIFWDYSKNAEAEEKDPNRPRLEPALIIDSVSSNTVLCHYEIQNIGHALAYNVLAQESGGEAFFKAQFEPTIMELAPEAKASIQSMGNFTETTNLAMFSRRLSLTYHTTPTSRDKGFGISFTFSIQREALQPGIFHYETARTSELMEILKKSETFVKRSLQQNAEAEPTYPGMSSHALLKIGAPIPGRDNFIFDLGEDLSKNRISLYIDPDRNLSFQVIDENSKKFTIKCPQRLDTFTFGSVIYLACEFGSATNFSCLRLAINGKLVAEHHQTSAIVLAKSWEAYRQVIGSDLNHQNGGVFDMIEFLSYPNTIKRKTLFSVIQHFDEAEKNHKKTMCFYGKEWMERLPGQNRDLHNSDVKSQPKLHVRSN